MVCMPSWLRLEGSLHSAKSCEQSSCFWPAASPQACFINLANGMKHELLHQNLCHGCIEVSCLPCPWAVMSAPGFCLNGGPKVSNIPECANFGSALTVIVYDRELEVSQARSQVDKRVEQVCARWLGSVESEEWLGISFLATYQGITFPLHLMELELLECNHLGLLGSKRACLAS
eukprot:scaffold152567_cov16-Tisochrysis_lutea.AAC.1